MQSATSVRQGRGRFGGERTIDPVAVFEVLANTGCRAVLTAIGDDTLTAAEISERVDAPMSSIYRHLDALSDNGFVEESVRINPHGRNQNQYARSVADISISLTDDFAVTFL